MRTWLIIGCLPPSVRWQNTMLQVCGHLLHQNHSGDESKAPILSDWRREQKQCKEGESFVVSVFNHVRNSFQHD